LTGQAAESKRWAGGTKDLEQSDAGASVWRVAIAAAGEGRVMETAQTKRELKGAGGGEGSLAGRSITMDEWLPGEAA